ncbi:VOC family protein [Pelagicoccus sp. SDUM812003]|uniref:VOC family protein n=1 Tax=Pelagicoccus sp. SDUM812003 TaxID=3041267 RepID=UPI00280DF9D3|nr:VOC family protein [Pelagicoccus sp. SDUM812003]MDQ8201398.1 VOC family protein [Pelagicoccus sp. SDUM812003]
MKLNTKVTPWLGFKNQAEEAAAFYTSLIPDSRVGKVRRNPANDEVLFVEFVLGGIPVCALNVGQDWEFTTAFSWSVACDTQEELDRIWNALCEGGKEVQCGWLEDRYGLSWQIVPAQLGQWMDDPDGERTSRVLNAVWSMVKLDIPTLQAAYEGREVT